VSEPFRDEHTAALARIEALEEEVRELLAREGRPAAATPDTEAANDDLKERVRLITQANEQLRRDLALANHRLEKALNQPPSTPFARSPAAWVLALVLAILWTVIRVLAR
jgi:hypothetical protein